MAKIVQVYMLDFLTYGHSRIKIKNSQKLVKGTISNNVGEKINF